MSNNFDYETLLEKVLNILKMEGLIDDIDWCFTDTNEELNITVDDKVYSFESGKNKKNIRITIDTIEE